MTVDPLNPNNLPKAPLRDDRQRIDVPYAGNRAGIGGYENPQNKLLQKLSMKRWDVDPLKVYKLMTNKELILDEYSRLVSDPR